MAQPSTPVKPGRGQNKGDSLYIDVEQLNYGDCIFETGAWNLKIPADGAPFECVLKISLMRRDKKTREETPQLVYSDSRIGVLAQGPLSSTFGVVLNDPFILGDELEGRPLNRYKFTGEFALKPQWGDRLYNNHHPLLRGTLKDEDLVYVTWFLTSTWDRVAALPGLAIMLPVVGQGRSELTETITQQKSQANLQITASWTNQEAIEQARKRRFSTPLFDSIRNTPLPDLFNFSRTYLTPSPEPPISSQAIQLLQEATMSSAQKRAPRALSSDTPSSADYEAAHPPSGTRSPVRQRPKRSAASAAVEKIYKLPKNTMSWSPKPGSEPDAPRLRPANGLTDKNRRAKSPRSKRDNLEPPSAPQTLSEDVKFYKWLTRTPLSNAGQVDALLEGERAHPQLVSTIAVFPASPKDSHPKPPQCPDFPVLHMHAAVIDSYSDLTLEEKAFIKRWDAYAYLHRPLFHVNLPKTLRGFVKQEADFLLGYAVAGVQAHCTYSEPEEQHPGARNRELGLFLSSVVVRKMMSAGEVQAVWKVLNGEKDRVVRDQQMRLMSAIENEQTERAAPPSLETGSRSWLAPSPAICTCQSLVWDWWEIVQCDNSKCRIGAFHLDCVVVNAAQLADGWTCPECFELNQSPVTSPSGSLNGPASSVATRSDAVVMSRQLTPPLSPQPELCSTHTSTGGHRKAEIRLYGRSATPVSSSKVSSSHNSLSKRAGGNLRRQEQQSPSLLRSTAKLGMKNKALGSKSDEHAVFQSGSSPIPLPDPFLSVPFSSLGESASARELNNPTINRPRELAYPASQPQKDDSQHSRRQRQKSAHPPRSPKNLTPQNSREMPNAVPLSTAPVTPKTGRSESNSDSRVNRLLPKSSFKMPRISASTQRLLQTGPSQTTGIGGYGASQTPLLEDALPDDLHRLSLEPNPQRSQTGSKRKDRSSERTQSISIDKSESSVSLRSLMESRSREGGGTTSFSSSSSVRQATHESAKPYTVYITIDDSPPPEPRVGVKKRRKESGRKGSAPSRPANDADIIELD